MANYTITLQELLALGYNIIDFDYNLTSLRNKQDLEDEFYSRYLNREIGLETVEAFKHHLQVLWKDKVRLYNKLWEASEMPINILSNSKGETSATVRYRDTPQSEITTNNYATSVTNNEATSGGYSGISEIELLENYYNKLRDIDDRFLGEFNCLFMKLMS